MSRPTDELASDRGRAEEMIAAAAEVARRLRESEERVRLAVAAGNIGTWDYYPTSGHLYWDDRCKEIHGLDAGEEVTYELFLGRLHPGDRQRVLDQVQRMLDPAQGGHYTTDYRIHRLTDGTVRWVSVSGSVMFDGAGQAVRFIGITEDITVQRQTEETRERLLGIVGHDLRGPLSAINIATQLIERSGTGVPLHLTAVVHRSVDRMAAMISQLLDFTRVRLGGGMALSRERCDLAELTRHIVEEVALSHGGRKPSFDVRGDCQGCWDPTRMGQVIANLLQNALLHGDPEGAVCVALDGQGDEVVIEVHNRGTPIAEQQLADLFDPFRRGAQAATRRREGLGLGLYISREIVTAHGGAIEASSSSASGTTFRVRVPRRAPEAADTGQRQ